MLWIVGAGAIVKSLDKMEGNAVTSFLSTQLSHVEWEGFRFYDLIFPLFLFLVGISIVFSLDKALEKGGRRAVLKRVFVRGILLYVLGIFLLRRNCEWLGGDRVGRCSSPHRGLLYVCRLDLYLRAQPQGNRHRCVRAFGRLLGHADLHSHTGSAPREKDGRSGC